MQPTTQFPGAFEAFIDSGPITKFETLKVGAMLDHSWNLLTFIEQETLKGLSIFHGGFTRQAAEEIVRTTPKTLQALLEKIFLRVSTGGRYELHELLRQLGREKLAKEENEEKSILSRHSNYFLQKLARFGQELKSPQQKAALSKN